MPVSVFQTELGWFALAGSGVRVERLWIGHRSRREVRSAYKAGGLHNDTEGDWHPELRMRLQRYAAGEPEDFCDVAVADMEGTPFRSRVLRTVRRVRYGETVTYGELAARSRAPGAARAVGSVMANNRVPIVYPCHRVVAAGGVGGFSAPCGIALKERMLELEGSR